MKLTSKILFLSLFLLLNTKTAHAYLDPGSGSFLFQLIIGGLLSGAFVIKLYFKKIKSFFSRKKIKDEKNEEA